MSEDINLKKAADATLKYIEMVADGADSALAAADYSPDGFSLEHQKDLLKQIITGELMDYKAHRCFGWCQAALVINGIGSLTVYKMINYCCRA